MARVVTLGIAYFPDPTKGRPVFNGQIFVGNPDTDPTIPANQQQISVQQEDGTIVPVGQPIMTNAGGVPVYNGSPVAVLVNSDYSIAVLNNQGTQVYYNSLDSDEITLPARSVSVVPAGNIAATDVQAALVELDTEKEPADATILKDADIGNTVQAFSSSIPIQVVSQAEAEAGVSTDNRTWTAERVKQAIDALAPIQGIGEGQAWTNVLADRSPAVTYTNSTGRSIYISITVSDPGDGLVSTELYVNGSILAAREEKAGGGFNSRSGFSAVIPNGDTYRVETIGGGAGDFVQYWWELR